MNHRDTRNRPGVKSLGRISGAILSIVVFGLVAALAVVVFMHAEVRGGRIMGVLLLAASLVLLWDSWSKLELLRDGGHDDRARLRSLWNGLDRISGGFRPTGGSETLFKRPFRRRRH
jgi:hypothetical protein